MHKQARHCEALMMVKQTCDVLMVKQTCDVLMVKQTCDVLMVKQTCDALMDKQARDALMVKQPGRRVWDRLSHGTLRSFEELQLQEGDSEESLCRELPRAYAARFARATGVCRGGPDVDVCMYVCT